MPDDQPSPSRRTLLKSPRASTADTASPEGKPNFYSPTTLHAGRWRFLNAAADRLIPHERGGVAQVVRVRKAIREDGSVGVHHRDMAH